MVTALNRDVLARESDTDTPQGVKKYQLALPNALYTRVHTAADDRGVTVVHLLRTFIKLGLLVLEAERQGGEVILRTENGEKQLVLV